MSPPASAPAATPVQSHLRDRLFLASLVSLGSLYVGLIVLLILADLLFLDSGSFKAAWQRAELAASVRLTLLTCTVSAILSVWVAVPLGYLLARFRFPGRMLVDAIVDLPLVLPPLVLGLSLLILFHLPFGGVHLESWLRREAGVSVTYHIPAVILAQFVGAAAFAVRTMRLTFERIPVRTEEVARTLGCTRSQAFFRVALPQAESGIWTAFTVAWARSLGEFGPILVFAGATRMKTEVLSTSVFLELSVGNLQAAVAVSLLMVTLAVIVLLLLRWLGHREAT